MDDKDAVDMAAELIGKEIKRRLRNLNIFELITPEAIKEYEAARNKK